MFQSKKEEGKTVNIFYECERCVGCLLSVYYNDCYFVFQKRRFQMIKAAVLHRKTAAFATLKHSYHFLGELSLQSDGEILPIR